jgi:hypothetical protein
MQGMPSEQDINAFAWLNNANLLVPNAQQDFKQLHPVGRR